ncbi:MAG: hypothetical protein ACI4V4_00850 [Eubacterium sp.]
MKIKDCFLLAVLLLFAGVLIIFSGDAKQGALNGLILAQNTIIPSLTPLLIIFLIIMKTGAKDVLSKCFGFISHCAFNLPYVTFPAIFLGLLGGYPTGPLLTKELFDNGEIDENQAKRMLRFNFCGGAGFIITAVGTAVMQNTRAGIILFSSNFLASVIVGFVLSFTQKRTREKFYSFTERENFGDALSDATSSAVNSVLNITAFIILFSALSQIITVDSRFTPLIEITNGICSKNNFSLPEISAYLAFGGLCIHFQLIGVIKSVHMKLWDFFIFRIIGAVLSFVICKIILRIFPVELAVFANSAIPVEFSSVNIALSVIMILGCFVIILDINSKRGRCYSN